MLSFLGKRMSNQMNNYDSTFKLGLINLDGPNDLYEQISNRKDIQLIKGITASNASMKIKENIIDLALIIPKNFTVNLRENKQVKLQIFHSGNSSQIDDLNSSISSFKQKIIQQRMDSLQLSSEVLNPISIQENNNTNFITTINQSISNYAPLLIFIFGFLGLIFPINILFSEAKEKREIRQNPLWNKMISTSLCGAITGIIFLVGMWFSISFIDGHPAFLKGFFSKYFSFIHTIHLLWVLFLSQLFWVSILAVFSHKSQKPLGAFGISYFTFTIFILGLLMASVFLGFMSNSTSLLFPFLPITNGLAIIKHLFLGEGISFIFLLLSILGFLLWGGIGYFIANKTIRD